MNWGYRIMLVYLVFVAGILLLVYKSGQQRSDLIADNYYEQELQYQQVINARKNAEPFKNEIQVTRQDSRVAVQLPVSVGSSLTNGTIEFLCLNDKRKDVKVDIHTGKDGIQYIDGAQLKKGNYQVQISWTDKKIPYYHEQSFFVN